MLAAMKSRDGERALLRLVQALRQRVGAEDARLEIGGAPPEGKRVLWAEVPGSGFRLVATFRNSPPDREEKLARMRAMAEAFRGVVASALVAEGGKPAEASASPSTALDEALATLAETTGALSVVVVDSSSPVLWGRSHAELEIAPRDQCAAALTRLGRWLGTASQSDNLATLIGADPDARIARLSAVLETRDERDEALLDELARRPDAFRAVALSARSVEEVRSELAWRVQQARLPLPRVVRHGLDLSLFARGLADVYALTLTFAGAMAEPRVDGAVRRAASHLERLVESIPPRDPTPMIRGARVIALRKP